MRRLPRRGRRGAPVAGRRPETADGVDRSPLWRRLCGQERLSKPQRSGKPYSNADRERQANGRRNRRHVQAGARDGGAVGEPGTTCYATVPSGPLLPHFIQAFTAAGFTYRAQLTWIKQHFVIGMADYHPRYEPILYGWLPRAENSFANDSG